MSIYMDIDGEKRKMKKIYGEIGQCFECGIVDWFHFKYGELESYRFECELQKEITSKYGYEKRFEVGEEVKVRFNKTIFIFTTIRGRKCDRCDPPERFCC